MREPHGVKGGLGWAVATVLLGLSAPLPGAEPPPVPDPEAIATLRRATDHLGGLSRFSLRGHATLEVVLTSGQKIQFDNDLSMVLERPNKLRATRKGELADQTLYYDGTTVTLYSPEDRAYAAVAAPATLEGMLDFSRDQLDIVAPAADLNYADAFERLTQDMNAGFVVSKRALLGARSCTHLAFRKPGVDIQIWVANGDRPLIYKYVLTTTDVMSSPQFTLTLSDWDTRPQIDANTFRFAPPADAKRIEFALTDVAPASPK
jgi:hypothetical protein